MTTEKNLTDRWLLIGSVCGICSIAAYLAAVFAPMPLLLTYLLAFSFGPLLGVGCLGLHFALTYDRPSVTVAIATFMALGGTVTLLIMITTQQSIAVLTDQPAQIADAADLQALQRAVLNVERLSRQGLNAVQLGMDVAWDVLISIALVLYAAAMWRHPAFGRLLSISGGLLGSLLLGFNLWYFPVPPVESNSIDWGPFVALWLLAVFGFMLAFRFSRSRSLPER